MNELRERVERRLRELGIGPIEAAMSVPGLERNYIRDLVEGKKQSFAAAKIALVAQALRWAPEDLHAGWASAVNEDHHAPAPEDITREPPEATHPDEAIAWMGLSDPLNAAKILARRMQALRLAEGYPTPASFAAHLGIDAKLLSAIEYGHPLSVENAHKIVLRVPGVDFNWLFYGQSSNLPLGLTNRLIAAARQLHETD
jgi:hypothetical protein